MKILTKRRKNWLLILASITSIYVIINLRYESPNLQIGQRSEDTLPQWILTESTAENFNSDGALSSRLRSDSAKFYAHSNTVNIIQPSFQYYQAEQLSWQAQADIGTGKNDMATLILLDNVTISNQDGTQIITSQWLSSDFNKNLLKTDKAVTITSPFTVVTATGMTGNWHDKTLKLHDDVHVQITPLR